MSNTSRQSTLSSESPTRAGGEGTNQQPNLKPVQVKLVLLGEFFLPSCETC
jgi:hypothetical protein